MREQISLWDDSFLPLCPPNELEAAMGDKPANDKKTEPDKSELDSPILASEYPSSAGSE